MGASLRGKRESVSCCLLRVEDGLEKRKGKERKGRASQVRQPASKTDWDRPGMGGLIGGLVDWGLGGAKMNSGVVGRVARLDGVDRVDRGAAKAELNRCLVPECAVASAGRPVVCPLKCWLSVPEIAESEGWHLPGREWRLNGHTKPAQAAPGTEQYSVIQAQTRRRTRSGGNWTRA